MLLEGEEKTEENDDGAFMQGEGEGEENEEISLHALTGLTNSKIIWVKGKVQDSRLMMLIDSRSTHCFLDEGTTKKLKCELTGT